MSDGQGFGSFEDLDKFIKQKPAVSSKQSAQLTPPPGAQKQEAGGGFKDFSTFDSFISEKAKKDATPKSPPAKWEDVSILEKPVKNIFGKNELSNEDAAKHLHDRFGINVSPDDPRLSKIWKEAWAQVDPLKHPIGFLTDSVSTTLRGIHDTAFNFFDFDTEAESTEKGVKLLQGALNEKSVKSNPEVKKRLESMLNMGQQKLNEINKDEAKRGVSLMDPGVIARAAATTYVDWESMGSLFKPLEWAGVAVKNVKALRFGVYAINQALGVSFSIPAYQDAVKKYESGDRLGALQDFGTGSALLFMPLLGHVTNEKAITQEQIRQKANEILEEKKVEIQKAEAEAKQNPNIALPVSSKFIEDMQYRLANGLPMMGIGRPIARDIPMPDRDLLNLGEQNLQNRIERENAKGEAQRRVGQLEQQQRELIQQRKIASEQAKTEAERRQVVAELDARGKALDEEIAREKERFKVETTGIRTQGPSAVEAPISEKKPFEPEPIELSGRPMTREEREDEWLEERRKRYTEQLAEEREQRLRAGEEIKVEDRRRFAEEAIPRALTPPPGATTAEPPVEGAPPAPGAPPAGPAEPLAPPPQSREQIQDKISAIAWQNQEFELRKAQAKSAEELAQIEKRMEDNRKMAGDLAGDLAPAVDVTKIGKEMETRRKPTAIKRGTTVSGPIGKSSELKTVTRNYPIRYRVVEGNELVPSHDPMTFEVNEGYPEGVQERDYQRDRDAQLAVIQHTQGYDPDFTLSDNPGPENGPPMVTPDGIVLGGNSRAMSTMRLYEEGGGDRYKQALMARASQLGLDLNAIQAMKQPVLVREFLSVPDDVQSLRALGSDLNKVFTRKLSEFEQAVSAGKRLSPETLEYILQQMQELGEGASIRDLLRERSKGILEKLEADGVIAATERRGFVDEKTDTLNEAGKDFVENAILGSVVDDPLVLANSPKGVLRKIERSLSSLARIKARGGAWDITDYLKEALREHIAAASKGESIQDHIDPPTASMFPREPIHPIVQGIALKLDGSSADVKSAFEGFSEDADLDVKGQGTMAFYAPPTPWDSFRQNFGVDVKPQQWGTVKAAPSVRGGAVAKESIPEHPSVAAPLEPPPSIGEIFDEEVARRQAEEGPPRHDLGEVEPVRVKSPSEQFRTEVENAFPKIRKEELDAVISIMEARAKTTGKLLDKWIEDHKLSVEGYAKSEEDFDKIRITGKKVSLLRRRVKAHVEFMADGRTIIRAFNSNNADVASLAHELFHIFRRDLNFTGKEALGAKDWLALEEWAGVKHSPEHGAIWTVPAEEKFARGFERYMRDGVAPSEGLRGVFEKFKGWLTNIYSALKKDPLNIKIPADVRKVFDKILAGEPKPLEEPPREVAEAPKQIETPPEPPPKRREIEIPEPGPKKRYEETIELPRRGLAESLRGMTDDDVRTAAKSIESQMRRPGLTAAAREQLESQFKPFRDEMDRRKILDRPEKGFGESNAIFTKSRADAARDRLRKKLGTTFYAGVDPELIRDVSEIMGYYFEGGIREFGSLARKIVSEFGEGVRPVLQQAYDQMLNRGRVEAKAPEQKSLFEPVRQIILPPGVEEEVRRAPETKAREERPPSVTPRKEADAGARAAGREATGRTPAEATRPEGRAREQASGRATRPAGAGSGGGGVVEQFKQPLRAVQTPQLDVEHITDIPHTVDPVEWKGRLKDANLPENLPPPTETLSPQVDKLLAFKGQPEIVQTVLTSLRKYNGAILATSTGTGKTYMGSAILAETRPRMGLIVAPSQNIAKQWIDTAELFGVEIKPLDKDIPTDPGIYTTTYSTATNRKGLDQVPWNMVIADESHYARRWHDEANQRGKFIVSISKNTDKMLYTSATPFHTPLELGYFDKLGLWKKTGLENWLAKEFGVRQSEGGKWIVPMNYRKLAALRDELINRGMFVNLDRNMEGYSANFAVVPISQDTMDGIRNATQAFRLAEEFFLSRKQNKMVMAVRGNAATFMKSFLERQRLPEAIELGKKLENEGWKVIYFTESKKEVDDIYNFLQPADQAYDGAISQKMPKLPGVVDTLKEAFGDDLADFTGAHSARRQEDLDDFNRGGKKHLVATYGAGGVGVSLHDLSGEAPRAVIYLGPPWSGVMFDQAIGRPWRFGTKSNVAAYFLTSNAQPEMKLIFQKVLPRFESLKASVSGIKKADPIVGAMKDLDAYLAYEFGNDTAVGFDQFMNTVQTSAVSSYKEVSITSANSAKNKGMRVERRKSLEEPPIGAPKLRQAEESSTNVPPDLPLPGEDVAEKEEKSASVVRRPFVSEQAEQEITDPRLLDQINDENMTAVGVDPGGERPPRPVGESISNAQIPRPGESEVRRDDLAAPKVMQRVYEFAEKHFGEWGVPAGIIDKLASVESGFRLWLAHTHTSPYILGQFPETKPISEGITKAERIYKRDLGNLQYEKTKILQENNLINDPIGRRKVDQALRMTDQGTPLMSLLGEPSKWLDGSVFKENELKAAQAIRDRIYEPVIEAVRNVRPDVGYRRKYSAVIKTMEDLVSTLYPDLNGKVPADLIGQFSLEVRRSMTRDPFSPHTLRRRGEPPKTWDIDDVMEAYLPGMLRVKHYTKLSRTVARQLAELPDSMLKEYSTKYARIFFGVPSEYKRMDRVRFKMARAITDLSYASYLEVNPAWALMHLSKVPVNTFPELGRDGGKYLMKGYSRIRTEEGRELVARSGLLMDRLWAFPEMGFELKKRPQGWLRLTTSASDYIDRSASYLAALEKAKDLGFLGPKEAVGDITWKRLNELSANGVDVEKALDYASSVVARSEFLYSPGNVQMWQREHPILGQFKHFLPREIEFVSTIRKIAKEVKAQADPEKYIEEQVSKGHYEYIDAVAKYRRLLMSLTGAAAVAFGIGGPLFSRFWPFHLSRLLSAPVMFAENTVELMTKTLHGAAKEDDWKAWAFDFFGSFVPGAGYAVRALDPYQKVTITKQRKKHRDFDTFPAEKFKFEPLPQ